ncbi:MAG: hypothetical protein KDB00_26130, partial [Planctomycetales bacterium]|nr:hypothetical protein [Planctomycetales bacterium]
MINKDDPRLTAYLLGELDESGHDEVQAALAESADLRKHVDGLRETILTLQSALGVVPSGADELTEQQIAAVEAAASVQPVAVKPVELGEEPRRVWLRRFALAALVLYAVGMSVFALRPAKINPEVASSMLAADAKIAKNEAPQEPIRELVEATVLEASVDEVVSEIVSGPNDGSDSVSIGFDGTSGLPTTDLNIRMNNDSFGASAAPDSGALVQDMYGTDANEGLDQLRSPSAKFEIDLDGRLGGDIASAPSGEESVGGPMGGRGGAVAPETQPGASRGMMDMMGGMEDLSDMQMGMGVGGRMDMMEMSQDPQGSSAASGEWGTKVNRAFLNELSAPELPPINSPEPASDGFAEEGRAEVWSELERRRIDTNAGDRELNSPLGAAVAPMPASEPTPEPLPASHPAGPEFSSPQRAKPALVPMQAGQAAESEFEELAAIAPPATGPETDAKTRQISIADEAKKAQRPAPKTWKPASASTNRARLSVGQHDDLLLAARDTYVRIDGFRARVMFDLYYYNDRGRQLEGQFMLRLPDDASLHYFAFGATNLPTQTPVAAVRTTGKPGDDVQPEPLDPAAVAVAALRKQTESVGSDLARRASDAMYKAESNSTFGAVKTAFVAPRQKAALAYEETVRRRVDPALVEWSGPGIFQTKVFPLMPGKLNRIVVGYDVSLEDVDDDRLFTLDLPEDEAGGRVEFDIVAAAGTQATLTPATDPFVSGGRAYHRYEGAAPRDYTARLSGTDSIMIQHTDSVGGQYFATRVIADLPEQQAKVDTRQAVLMLDTSWSDRPDAFSKRLELMEQILSNNRDSIDQFAVMMFNVHSRWWRNEFVANNDQNVKAFLEFANDLALEGATDLSGAITEATAPQWNAASDESLPQPNLFLLSDAVATWGTTDLMSIAAPLRDMDRNLGGGALFAYQFSGLPSDRMVLGMLADVSGGSVFNVAEKAELAKVATAHRSRPWQLAKATADGADEVLVQSSANTIYPGQPLLIAGRGAIDGPIELVFKRGSETQTMTISPRLVVKSPAAARLYGGIAVERLEPFAEDYEEITIAFARHFRVPGRTCSMVMLDSEQDYQRFGVNTAPEEDHLVIASTSVQSLMDSRESALKQPSNSRARFLSWTESLESASLLKVSTALRLAINQMPETSFAFSPRPLDCRSYRRGDFGQTYLDDLAAETPEFDSMMAEADEILIAFGADDAIKAASTLVEAKPSDVEILRSVAFRAIEWKRGDQAAPLLWRIAQARPHQPQCLMLLARSLAAGGDLDASIVCYDLVTGGNWNQRWGSVQGIAKVELMSVLEQIDPQNSSIAGYAKARLHQLRGEIAGDGLDVAIFMHWNTDRTDVDLHVTEPGGEECFYKNKSTKAGGRMTDDITEGLGPEMYTLQSAPEGDYHVQAKYFRSDQNRTKAPTEILVTLVRDLGRPSMKSQTKRLTLSG